MSDEKKRVPQRILRGLTQIEALARSDFESDQSEDSSRWSKLEAREVSDALDWLSNFAQGGIRDAALNQSRDKLETLALDSICNDFKAALIAADERARALAEAARAEERERLREPTPEMIEAGMNQLSGTPTTICAADFSDALRAAISAAIRARGQAKADAAGSGW